MAEKVQTVNITVNGGYQASVVTVQKGQSVELAFKRTNAQGCLDVVHSKELGFDTKLPLNETQTIKIPTDKAGEFQYSCGMDMFSGKVVIADDNH